MCVCVQVHMNCKYTYIFNVRFLQTRNIEYTD